MRRAAAADVTAEQASLTLTRRAEHLERRAFRRAIAGNGRRKDLAQAHLLRTLAILLVQDSRTGKRLRKQLAKQPPAAPGWRALNDWVIATLNELGRGARHDTLRTGAGVS